MTDLEAEYNARAAIPDHPQIFAEWERRSAEARRKAADWLDLEYGPHPRERYDVFPAQNPEAPLAVYIHGGYWQWNDKAMFSFVGDALAQAGFTTAVLNYPQAPEVAVADIADSIRRALGMLWTNAARLRCDCRRVYVVGHSAGAHLAAMALATDFPALDASLPKDLIKGVLAVSGVYDLRSLVQTSMNEGLGLTEETARAASPAFMDPVGAAPLMVAFGGLESRAFIDQSRGFATAWAAKGLRTAEMDLADRNHLTIVDDLGSLDGRLVQALVDMARA